MMKKCHTSQVHKNLNRKPYSLLQDTRISWPFHTLGLDLIETINSLSNGCISHHWVGWSHSSSKRYRSGGCRLHLSASPPFTESSENCASSIIEINEPCHGKPYIHCSKPRHEGTFMHKGLYRCCKQENVYYNMPINANALKVEPCQHLTILQVFSRY